MTTGIYVADEAAARGITHTEYETMRMSKVFESRYLAAADVEEMGGEVTYTISRVVIEQIGQKKEDKPIVYFRQHKKGLVLNQINNTRLIGSLGDESDEWIGRNVTLEVEQVPFQGKIVPGIRCRIDGRFLEERRPPTAKEAAQAAQKPLDDFDDDHQRHLRRFRPGAPTTPPAGNRAGAVPPVAGGAKDPLELNNGLRSRFRFGWQPGDQSRPSDRAAGGPADLVHLVVAEGAALAHLPQSAGGSAHRQAVAAGRQRPGQRLPPRRRGGLAPPGRRPVVACPGPSPGRR